MAQALVKPSVIIDGVVIAIVPNSASYQEGFGEREVKVQSSGGGSVEPVIMENVETNLSPFKFSMFNTEENIARMRAVKSTLIPHIVQMVDVGFNRTFSQAIITNDPEIKLGADEVTEFEWKGRASV